MNIATTPDRRANFGAYQEAIGALFDRWPHEHATARQGTCIGAVLRHGWEWEMRIAEMTLRGQYALSYAVGGVRPEFQNLTLITPTRLRTVVRAEPPATYTAPWEGRDKMVSDYVYHIADRAIDAFESGDAENLFSMSRGSDIGRALRRLDPQYLGAIAQTVLVDKGYASAGLITSGE